MRVGFYDLKIKEKSRRVERTSCTEGGGSVDYGGNITSKQAGESNK